MTTPDPIAEILSEVSGIEKAIKDFHENIGDYLSDSSLGSIPDLNTLAKSLKFDKLITISNEVADLGADISAGAISDIVQKAASIQREISLRTDTKASLYQKAVINHGNIGAKISEESGITINQIRGTSPEQSVNI